MNSYLNAGMQLSIKTFAISASFPQPVGYKDMDADIESFIFQPFLVITKITI